MTAAIGPYQVLAELGRGANGAVYRALDPRNGAEVAVKVLLAGEQASERQRARFETELQALTRLRHPNVVGVWDAGLHQGKPYLVMEYVPGDSLAALLQRGGPLPSREAAELTRALADAVETAHRAGLIHRDLKPDNVLIDPSGQPRLTDFGLARDLNVDSRLSAEGVFLGTPGYWPPEQASGKLAQLGPAADVYGLGALLYATLTGQPPLLRATLNATLHATLHERPRPPRRLNPQVDPGLEAICLKCLAKRPEQRYGSARELAQDLNVYLAGLQPLALGGPTGTRGAVPAPVWALAILVAAGAAAAALVLRAPPREVAPQATPGPSLAPSPVDSRAPSPTPPEPSPPGPVPSPQPTGDLPPSVAAQADHELDLGQPTSSDPAAEGAINESARLAAAKDLPGALATLSRALTASPNDVGLLRQRSRVLSSLHRREDAWADLERALSAAPDDPSLRAHRVIFLRQSGRLEEALREAESALGRWPEVTPILRERALTLRQLRRFEQALQAVEELLRRDPDDADSLAQRGLLLLTWKNDPAGAEADADRALQQKPLEPIARYVRAMLLRRQGNPRGALQALEPVMASQADNYDFVLFMGETQQELRDWAAMERTAERLLALAPQRSGGWLMRAAAHEANERKTQALADYTRALELEPDSLIGLVNRGIIRLTSTPPDLEGARQDLERAVARYPKRIEGYLALGRVHEASGDLQAAVQTWRQAATVDPKHPKPHYLAGALFLRQGKLDAAEDAYRRCTTLQPGWLDARLQLGLVHVARGELPAAREDLTQAEDMASRARPEVVRECQALLDQLRRELAEAEGR